uniref:RRM domain-containing protein n=1 Tax=Syphacia muris TaxID=451379 RepID=A0A0N5ADQ1_9BILA
MSEAPLAKRAKREEVNSPVVHVRNLNPLATEADLVEALSHFGCVSYVFCIPKKRMALVEFEEASDAQNCVEYASGHAIYVAGDEAQFAYSISKKVQRYGLESAEPNHVLILTVYKAFYPINVKVIHQICSPYGNVKRIVIIRRILLQSLVEFDTVEEARTAKRAINGADIYTGCCTIKAEFAKPDVVNVQSNTMDAWDFTNTLEISPNKFHSGVDNNLICNDFGVVNGPVIMVYGIDQIHFNCLKLFNLFCLYGNCEKVKFMRRKVNTAMVQMGSVMQAYVAISNIHGLEVFGCKLSLEGSKQMEIHMTNKFTLPDGTNSLEDYTNSRNQRYSSHEAAAKNRIVAPVKMLHWFNAPPEVTESAVAQVFNGMVSEVPVNIMKFNTKNDSRSSKGICVFDSLRGAAEAVMLVNHTPMASSTSKYPYIFKLTFAGKHNLFSA